MVKMVRKGVLTNIQEGNTMFDIFVDVAFFADDDFVHIRLQK